MSEMSLILRPAVTEDVPALAELEKSSFSDPWSERLLAETMESVYDEVWVLALADGTLAGYLNARFLGDEGELMRIAVRPDLRGFGYSRKLMERLVKSAGEKGAKDLTLEVRAGNAPALNLYKSWGFQAEAVRKDYYRNPREDAVIMWRRGLLGITT